MRFILFQPFGVSCLPCEKLMTVRYWHISAIRQSLLLGNELADDVYAVAPTALGGK
jgi:hypothetical protein